MRRNNEEFKAEIFSRSEKIIAKRKRVKQIVVCCVPLVLCVFLTTYVYFSNNGVKAESAFDGAENIFDGFSQERRRKVHKHAYIILKNEYSFVYMENA